jgi:hypothetical protein
MSTWHLYPALIRFGLSFCDDLPAFRSLMAEQSATAKACREEAPEVASEIRAMCEVVRERLATTTK